MIIYTHHYVSILFNDIDYVISFVNSKGKNIFCSAIGLPAHYLFRRDGE